MINSLDDLKQLAKGRAKELIELQGSNKFNNTFYYLYQLEWEHLSQLERLRFTALVDDRTVGFLLHGTSLEDVKRHSEALKQKNWCWGSLNRFWLAEEALGREMDFICQYDGCHHDNPKVQEFKGLKLFHHKCEGYNSLSYFLKFCVELAVPRVVLFGANGYSDENESTFYGEDVPCLKKLHKRDTIRFNESFPSYRGKTQIINCSRGTKYTCFPNVEIEDVVNAKG